MCEKITYSEKEKKNILEMGNKDGFSLRKIDLDKNQKVYISMMAKGLAGFIFRNGPVEDMHADGKLSDEDMKTLNKFMVEKLAEYLAVYVGGTEEDRNLFDKLIYYPTNCNMSWDDPTLSDLPYDLMLAEIMSGSGF